MNSQEIILNIAVNLGRLGRWAHEKNYKRIPQFISDNEYYLNLLDKTKKSKKIEPTLNSFTKNYNQLISDKNYSDDWAESMFTWSNILTHRSKLA